MSQNIFFYAQTGLPDPAIWEAALSDLHGDYTVEVEEREDASPIYGEIMRDGVELVQFELYAPAQTAEGFDGASGKSIFEEDLELARTKKAKGNPEVIAALDKTTELLVFAILWGDRDDEQVFRDLDPLLDWLHKTAKGIRYEDDEGFFDATAKL